MRKYAPCSQCRENIKRCTCHKGIGWVEARARSAGSHWFDADALRFFRSRVAPETYRDASTVFFLSSEQFVGSTGYASPRFWTVRKIDILTGDIGTVGEFQAYNTKRQAMSAASKLGSRC